MASYKDRLTRDLDRWIADGLVGADKRTAILAAIPDPRRLDAATALAWVGGALLGVAVIAFVAANWDGLPRIARFIMLLAFFAAAAGAGAWAASKSRPILSDIALTVAALIFAASIGLTGQIFDIAGEPQAALRGAGVAALLLALAGRSIGAGIAALVFVAIGDLDGGWVGNWEAPWLLAFAPFGATIALRWNSASLAHASSLGLLVAAFRLAGDFGLYEASLFLVFAILCAGGGLATRWFASDERTHASVFYGWAAAGALLFFALAGYADGLANEADWGLAHRIAWLAASGATIALGRHDRHMLVTAAGIVSFAAAIWAILVDLGLDLMSAAGVFFLCALGALIGGLALRRKANP